MKYLLSDGNTTTSVDAYLIDAFSARVKLYQDSIPKSDKNGLTRNYSGVEDSMIQDNIKYNLVKIAASISSRLVVTSIEGKLGSYVIEVKLGDLETQLTF